MELFHTHSRKRTKNEGDKVAKKQEVAINENGEVTDKIDLDGTLFGPCYDPGTDLLRGFDTNISKMKTCSKKSKKDIPRNDVNQEDDVGPEWIDGEPQGIESYIVDGNDGILRRKKKHIFNIFYKFVLNKLNPNMFYRTSSLNNSCR